MSATNALCEACGITAAAQQTHQAARETCGRPLAHWESPHVSTPCGRPLLHDGDCHPVPLAGDKEDT